METSKLKEFKEKCKSSKSNNSSMSCLYGLGLIGSSVYFISHATGFLAGVVGVLKSLVWPAVLVYNVFEKLGL